MNIGGTLALLLMLLPTTAAAQANGQLQIHFIKVGQGDAALIVSPLGETLLIDSGPQSASNCASATGIITYLVSIGVTKLDYHVASHYDADHIGCSDYVAARWPIQKVAYDRGTTSVPTTIQYGEYAAAVASKRQTVSVGQQIVLDPSSSVPVVFHVVAVNANGFSTSNENDRGVVLVLRFGTFDAEFGGDISSTMEGRIASTIGQVEVHKVHHHGSATSSSAAFLAAIRPRVAVLSVGSPNAFNHPTQTALTNIHNVAATTTYWTTPGDGAPAQPVADVVANGAVVVGVFPGASTFAVSAAGATTPYADWGASPTTCSFGVTPSSMSAPARGATVVASVTTTPGCLWNAVSTTPWLTVIGASSGAGNGTVSLAVSANYGGARTATVTIGGQAFVVVQSGLDAVRGGDFDGDGKTDIAVFRPSTGAWYILNSSTATPSTYSWGGGGDIPVPADYDGDGKADIAVFRPSTGEWYILNSRTATPSTYSWGGSEDIPVPADYDGDGKTDVGVFRPSTGTWYILNSGTATPSTYSWGGNGDTPVPGDYDGDGKADIAVFRPSTGAWYIRNLGAASWGGSGDMPLPADYDGDGKTDIAVFRPSTGAWYILNSRTATPSTYSWGGSEDMPVPGDYDGDAKSDVGVFRPRTGTWYIINSGTGFGSSATWGGGGDTPI